VRTPRGAVPGGSCAARGADGGPHPARRTLSRGRGRTGNDVSPSPPSAVLLRLLALIGGAALLGACVTTEGRVFTGRASPEEALEARVQLARGYIGKKNWEDAKRNLRQAAEIDPDSPDVLEAFALAYQSTGEFELAEESFRRALRLRPDFSRARNNYAAFLFDRGRFEEAEDELEIVVEDTLYEFRPRAFVNLGLCRLRLRDSDGAREALGRALTMDRANRLALLELAHIEFDRGNWEAADRHFDAYRDLSRSQSPRALWLGVRLAHELGDADARASRALTLRNLYPQSAEYRAYEEALRRGDL